ncbi:MAG: response regulator [Synechococcaceae cyanobacterium SM2_3_1]|nr:response regulator [Synechococcaceae cyanobacterium SM2_3_1]
MPEVSTSVLIAQSQPEQSHLWQLIFQSQGHQVIQVAPQAQLFETVLAHAPGVLVADTTTGLFNPFALCRECKSKLPGTKVLLTRERHRPVEPAEQRWAKYQGATELLPGLPENGQLLPTAELVLELIGCTPINKTALQQALVAPEPEVDTNIFAEEPPAETPSHPPAPPEPESIPPSAAPAYKPVIMYRGRPVKG